ncbi:MAG: hypothetical protein M0C28_38450 [Candidatus Moduliflexus flocculans]|nr:hypothetical protein [Candidatus Moduliflexus flocculans]
MDLDRRTPRRRTPGFGGATKVYNVIDTRQSYLQKVVVQGLRSLKFDDQAAKSIHFSYEMVALSPKSLAELGYAATDEEKDRAFLEVSGPEGSRRQGRRPPRPAGGQGPGRDREAQPRPARGRRRGRPPGTSPPGPCATSCSSSPATRSSSSTSRRP